MHKYNSVWQVLNAGNTLDQKYEVIEDLIDGLIREEKEKWTQAMVLPPAKAYEVHNMLDVKNIN